MQHKNSIFLPPVYPNNVIVSCCFSKQNDSEIQFYPKNTAKFSDSKTTLQPPKKQTLKQTDWNNDVLEVKKDDILQPRLIKQPIVWKLLLSSSNIYLFCWNFT